MDLLAGEIATELVKQLIQISRKSCLCKASANQLIATIQEHQPIIREIQYSGVELPAHRQFQIAQFWKTLKDGRELCDKVLASNRWNIYNNLQFAWKIKKMDKRINAFFQGVLPAHALADVHHLRFDTKEQLDRVEASTRRLEQSLSDMRNGDGGWVGEAGRGVDQLDRVEASMRRLEQSLSEMRNDDGESVEEEGRGVDHLRFDTKEQLDRVEASMRRLEQSLSEMRNGDGGWVEEAVRPREVAEAEGDGFGGGELSVGASVEVGKRKVREMIVESKDMGVVKICGIGGSGKTTLAMEGCKDDEIRGSLNDRDPLQTVSHVENTLLKKKKKTETNRKGKEVASASLQASSSGTSQHDI